MLSINNWEESFTETASLLKESEDRRKENEKTLAKVNKQKLSYFNTTLSRAIAGKKTAQFTNKIPLSKRGQELLSGLFIAMNNSRHLICPETENATDHSHALVYHNLKVVHALSILREEMQQTSLFSLPQGFEHTFSVEEQQILICLTKLWLSKTCTSEQRKELTTKINTKETITPLAKSTIQTLVETMKKILTRN